MKFGPFWKKYSTQCSMSLSETLLCSSTFPSSTRNLITSSRSFISLPSLPASPAVCLSLFPFPSLWGRFSDSLNSPCSLAHSHPQDTSERREIRSRAVLPTSRPFLALREARTSPPPFSPFSWALSSIVSMAIERRKSQFDIVRGFRAQREEEMRKYVGKRSEFGRFSGTLRG